MKYLRDPCVVCYSNVYLSILWKTGHPISYMKKVMLYLVRAGRLNGDHIAKTGQLRSFL